MLSPKELIKFFEDESEKDGKLFVPDSPREEKVAKSLLNYTKNYSSEEVLLESIKLFIESRTEVVLVFDYALEAKFFRDKVETDISSKNQFQKVLEQTKKRYEESREKGV